MTYTWPYLSGAESAERLGSRSRQDARGFDLPDPEVSESSVVGKNAV